jgi:hypothetical protein
MSFSPELQLVAALAEQRSAPGGSPRALEGSVPARISFILASIF